MYVKWTKGEKTLLLRVLLLSQGGENRKLGRETTNEEEKG